MKATYFQGQEPNRNMKWLWLSYLVTLVIKPVNADITKKIKRTTTEFGLLVLDFETKINFGLVKCDVRPLNFFDQKLEGDSKGKELFYCQILRQINLFF